MYQYAIFVILGMVATMGVERVAVLVRLAPTLKDKLVELAARERRSLSKQVEVLLERCLAGKEQTPEGKPTKPKGRR